MCSTCVMHLNCDWFMTFYVKGDHGYPLNNLTVGHHIIKFVFTPTGSSEALCPQPHKFIMCPTSKFIIHL